MTEELLPYPCTCGGVLKKSHTQVEFFGIDFGIRECEVCTKCATEYLGDETLDEIEMEVKKKKLFGLEQQTAITKSGNSLVIRLPPPLVKFAGLRHHDRIRLYPAGKNRIEIEIQSG